MSAYQSASQRAARQAAAELAMEEGDAPFHHSREVPRLALGAEDETVLELAGSLRPRDRNGSLRVPPSLSASAVATAAAPLSVTEKEGSWAAMTQSGSPLSNGNPSFHTSQDITRNASASGASGGSPLTNAAAGSASTNQRHLERMALPRDAHGVPFEPSQPNYGHVLSFAEEEERDRRRAEQRLHSAKSPRTPRASISTPRVAERPADLSSTTVSHASPAEKPKGAPAKPRPLTAAEQARLEKLAAPKKYPEPNIEPERSTHPRTSSSAAGGAGSTTIFDRLYASKKQPDGVAGETTPPLQSSSTPHIRCGPMHTPAATKSSQPSDERLQRLARPKTKPETHKDVNGLEEYNPHGPAKRYYGGTTLISGPPPPPPTAAAATGAGRGNSRIPKPTWDSVDRTVLLRSQASLSASKTDACAECEHTLPKQTVEVVAQPTSSLSAAAPQAAPSRALPPVRPVAATTGGPAAVQVCAPTVVASAPAKPSGTRPPIVVRTRRYVPPSEEEDETAEEVRKRAAEAAEKSHVPSVAAPQPVEATRRRTASASAARQSPLPEKPEPVVAAASVAPVAASAPVHASQEESSPSPAVGHAAVAVHVVKPVPPTVAEHVTRAAVQATRRRSSSSSAPAPSPEAPAESQAPVTIAKSPRAPTPTTVAPPASASAEPSESPAPAPVVATRHPTPVPVQATRRAPSATAESTTSTPTHSAVQAVKRAPRPPSPPAPAATPVATTATLTPAIPQVSVSSSSVSSAKSVVGEDARAECADAPELTDAAAVELEEKGDGGALAEEEEELWRVAPPMPKSASSPTARPRTSVYDRLAPLPLPADKLKTPRHTHKKKCVRPPKPEVLKDEEFACQLEDVVSPEPRRPVVVHKKPKTPRKKAAAAKKRKD